MKIVSLIAENVKRVKAVEITPQGNMVQITGKNGQGKSSVLDAIYFALAGGKMPKQPIRKGETQARIKLDLGEIVVTRKFTEAGSTLTVEGANGARFPTPQRMLDDMIGSISFDPLAFSRMEPRAQFDTLRQVAKVDVDLDALAGQRQRDYEKRTDVNRQVATMRLQADTIKIPDGTPEGPPLDIDALLQQMADASKTNADIEKRRSARDTAAATSIDKMARANELDIQAKALRDEANALAERLQNAEPLPDLVNVDTIRSEIANARVANEAIALLYRKRNLVADVEKTEADAQALTDAIAAADAVKADAIAKAKMPIPDITLGDGIVLFNGIPFEQASSAEQLRVSVAIAMAANPKIRVMRIKEGGLLDEDGMKLLEEMANANDYQCWIETVHANGPVAVEMVDGMAKAAPTEDEQKGKLL